MSNAEQYYIWKLLEPNDRIIVGNAKRYDKIKVPVTAPLPKLTEREDNERQDEYLKRYGI